MARAHYPAGVPDEIELPTNPLSTLLDRAVADFPNRHAIDFIGQKTTYAELGEMVKKTASMLTLAGVKKGDVVAVILPNCTQHVAIAYATWAIGATLAEHNPLAATSELVAQIDNHGAQVVIGWEQTLEKLANKLPGRTILAVNLTAALPKRSQLLLKLPIKAARAQKEKMRGKVPSHVFSFEKMVASAPAEYVAEGPDMDDVAVYLHTGGTTGTPKAVCLTHFNLMSNYSQVVAWLHEFKRGGETIASILPFFHAFGMMLSLVLAIGLAGTQNVLPTFDPKMLIASNKRHPITFFAGVPPMYEKLLEAMGDDPNPFTKLNYSVSGAMPLLPKLAAQWEKATDSLVIEGYGMTESSPVISGSPISADRRPSTLGLPFPSIDAKIVNPDNIEVEMPEGEVGELIVRGPNIFVGYLNQPEETAATLIDGEWLRTGDLARWDDGFLVMADRRKEMIIRSGFNVYPSQVEDVVRSMPGVRDVAVVGVPDGSRGEQVVAALVLEPGASIDLENVRKWTQDKLSHYSMPKSIAIFDELPRSQLGKVMRRSVKEQLNELELTAGQWRKKLSETGEDLMDRATELRSKLEATSAKTKDEKVTDTEASQGAPNFPESAESTHTSNDQTEEK
ncbi:AMP-binding protein [Flaviflexus massiliensis]|uniref:AMP-binding protein n=1 Tax=Flaviflexus massiliensis TaxID=1522309 RepID=UPI00097DCD10|nr:AMP-binding protein [Flaviflexus massiliensis]